MEGRRDRHRWDAGDDPAASARAAAPTSMESRRVCYRECGSPFGAAGPIIIEAGAVTATPAAGIWYAENQALDPSRVGFGVLRSPSSSIPGAVPPSEVEPASLTSNATTSTSVRLNAHAIHAGEVAWRPALAAPGSHIPRGGDQAREKPAGTLERALREACLYEPMMLVGGTSQTVTVELHRSMCIVLGDQAGTPAVLALSEGVGLAHQLTGIGPLQPEDIACGTKGAVNKDLQPCSIQWAPPPARPLTLHSVEKINVCEGDNGDPCPPNTRSEGKHESEQVEECNECAICLEPLQMGETIRLCCGHLFCLECTAQVCLSVCLSACLSVCLSVFCNGSMRTLSTNTGI